MPLCKVLTHNVKLPVRFHELSSNLWIFRTACDGLSVVLDCRNEAHLRAGCVYVDHFILLRIKRQTLNIKYSTWKKWVQFRWTIEILWHSRNGINPLGRMDWYCFMGMWVIAVPLPLPTHNIPYRVAKDNNAMMIIMIIISWCWRHCSSTPSFSSAEFLLPSFTRTPREFLYYFKLNRRLS